MENSMSLKDKIALITGGSRGIGAAIAEKYASLGATVIIIYQGSDDRARALTEKITTAGGQAEAMKCDVADFAACEELVKDIIKKYKRIDILVNNAGITADGLVMTMREEDFDRVIDVNLKGAFNMVRFVSRYMIKQKGGRIINMSSVSGMMGNPGQVNYAASKAGLIGLTKSLAKELASRNIICNAIAPGFIETEMTEKLSDSVRELSEKMIPLGRFGKTEDVANAAAFLASDLCSYMTGQVIQIDGGLYM